MGLFINPNPDDPPVLLQTSLFFPLHTGNSSGVSRTERAAGSVGLQSCFFFSLLSCQSQRRQPTPICLPRQDLDFRLFVCGQCSNLAATFGGPASASSSSTTAAAAAEATTHESCGTEKNMKKIYIGKTALKSQRNGCKHQKRR